MLLSEKGETDLYVWMAASLQRKAFVCVYECVSVCVFVHVCLCVCMYVHVFICVHVYKYAFECVHVHTHMHLCVLCVYENAFAHA